MQNERLSALMDDELPPSERGQALDALCGDHALRRTWSRYHLIGDALRDQAPVARPARAPLAARPARLPLAGLAIAAGVAALAVTVLLRPPAAVPAGVPALAVATPPVVASPPQLLPATAVAPLAVSAPAGPAVENARLRGYLVNFNEQRARRGVPGVHPYVRIVGYEAR